MKRVFYLCVLLLMVVQVEANDPQKESTALQCCIASPNATAIARYGDIPMNYYTGRANISVPIYHTSQRGVDLDVSLSYDTQGIIATSLPGWTGHNWTLNAGGVITRVKNGLVDEFQYSSYHSNWKNYFTNPEKLTQYVNEYDTGNDISQLIRKVILGDYDCNPDVFYFNFMGKSGRFFYGSDGQWKVLSDDNICVVFDVDDSNNYIHPYFKYHQTPSKGNKQRKTIKGFTLVDENGTQYIFGDNSNSTGESTGQYETRASAIEYSQPFFTALANNISSDDYCESMTASAWYLTEVRDRYGCSLYRFEYERGMFLVQASYMYEDIWETYDDKTYPQSWSDFHCALCLNSPVYLSRITIPLANDKIEFIKDMGRVLSSSDFYPSFTYDIYTLKRYAAESYVSDELFYFLQGNDDYVTQYQNQNSNKKNNPLASMGMSPLKNITIYANDKQLESYDFEYTTGNTRLFLTNISITNDNVRKNGYSFTYNHPESLPREYITIATDDWGYYNNGSLTNRTPNFNLTKYGMLEEIQYPTGGVTVITYNQNHYSRYFNKEGQCMVYENGSTGGLVVSEITNYEDATKSKILSSKTYTYSEGQLYTRPKHGWTWTSPERNVVLTIHNYNSIVPLCNSFGPHIGYSTVRETNADGTYTRYTYQNIDCCMDERPLISVSDVASPFDVFSERGYKRGKLSSVETFDDRNYSISYIHYIYRTDNVESKFVYNTNLTGRAAIISGNSAQGTYSTGCVYKMFYPKYDVIKVYSSERYESSMVDEVTEYDKEDITVTAFGKLADVRKCKSETVTRGNSKLKTEYLYPCDETGINQNLVSQFYLPATSVKRYYDGVLINGKRTQYGHCHNNFVPMYDIVTSNNANVRDTVARYEAYSPNGRLMKMTDNHGVTHRYFWNNKDQLAATVANGSAGINVTPNATKSVDVVTSSLASEVFGTEPTAITTCIYNERGLASSITTANRQTTYYDYDTFGRLVSVRDGKKKKVTSYGYHYRTGNGDGSVVNDAPVAVGGDYIAYPVSE